MQGGRRLFEIGRRLVRANDATHRPGAVGMVGYSATVVNRDVESRENRAERTPKCRVSAPENQEVTRDHPECGTFEFRPELQLARAVHVHCNINTELSGTATGAVGIGNASSQFTAVICRRPAIARLKRCGSGCIAAVAPTLALKKKLPVLRIAREKKGDYTRGTAVYFGTRRTGVSTGVERSIHARLGRPVRCARFAESIRLT